MIQTNSPYTLRMLDVLGAKGATLTWFFNMDEHRDDSKARGIATMAAKLIFWRKHPYLGRVSLLTTLSSMWVELRAFVSYERGKFYTQFVPDVIRQLPEIGKTIIV